jgi:hypothetical protein
MASEDESSLEKINHSIVESAILDSQCWNGFKNPGASNLMLVALR